MRLPYFSVKDILKNQLARVSALRSLSHKFHRTGINNDSSIVEARANYLQQILELHRTLGTAPEVIAEFGPGQTDRLLMTIRERLDVSQCFAIDVKNYFPSSHWKAHGIIFKYFHQAHLISDSSLDFIFSFDVLEHVRDPDYFVQELKRLLSEKGLAYFSWDLRDHLNLGNEERWFEMHKFSETAWNLQMSARSTYVNRLQPSDWYYLFSKYHLAIELLEIQGSKQASEFVERSYGLVVDPTYRISLILKHRV
jgi:SAM-dependent methyltransferase